MRGVRLTVEVGPSTSDVEPVLDVDLDDLADAVSATPVPIQWTWEVEGAVMRVTATRATDTPAAADSGAADPLGSPATDP